ncbi:hypothetical protein NMY22_g8917 [Coprinellus aureogranulatus]|nr:hypothetical protein NMY22_g8917 [Coprinellus aureogranulatus]
MPGEKETPEPGKPRALLFRYLVEMSLDTGPSVTATTVSRRKPSFFYYRKPHNGSTNPLMELLGNSIGPSPSTDSLEVTLLHHRYAFFDRAKPTASGSTVHLGSFETSVKRTLVDPSIHPPSLARSISLDFEWIRAPSSNWGRPGSRSLSDELYL